MSDDWPARVVLLTSPGCHLCEEARAAMARVARRTGADWAEVSLADRMDLWRDYGDRLPVVILDGREHGYWEVEEERLVRDLTGG
ncbi:thioredoxin family protein [Actinorhabdospora filicis]|uniref:Thioredoxin family protein n=1 Tax=Actinorhabdospora filicis TaxID=1785913 RepID=A0A9W6SKE8_9ACTN|nr:glutaredoxin family protein [Actinorhabdospora filicis]GLZ77447.1 thioredoxin family protein [Actinorhabdospora filicis]